MSFQSMIRWLLPREDHFFDFIERQAQVARDAARAMAAFKDGGIATEVRMTVQNLEHEGDRAVHGMLDALAKSFATPIDREDLQKLSKRLDDITDKINLAARAWVLFGVEKPTKPMLAMIDKLVESTSVLAELAPLLRTRDYKRLIADCGRVSAFEKDGDQVFRNALSELFHDPAIDAKTILREKEVLEDLERALNHCDQVAEILTNIAVKHG